ncbi:MAG TPA: hypothetical protein DFS52_27550 [Myxococcales bacterium]|jgi:hypothetical protein|nr:hypothetical protein [Myxococcales bacterium]
MRIKFAHIHEQGIDFVVFDADATSRLESDRGKLLSDLMIRARASGLKVDKAALAFMENGRLTYYGTPDLVRFLANNFLPRWTHHIDV